MSDLKTWLKTFTKKRRTEKDHFVLDAFSADFCIVFDCEDVEDPAEFPETVGKCDILFEPLPHRSHDPLADRIPVVSNANKHGVMRMIAALGISRFGDDVKKAFYDLGNPLRKTE